MSEPQTVIVTGATSGIGKAVAERFGAAGARVVISGRDADRGEAVARHVDELGGTGLFVATELADEASVRTLGARAQEAFGPPHVLVNCGGILQSGTRVLDQDLAENDRLWEVNYRGTLICCQVFGAQMKAAGQGAIVNIASLASFAPLSLPAYTPGKAAIVSLTEILAAELGPHGVRVNAVAPGYTLSDGLQQKIDRGERDPEAITASTALKAFVLPEHVAETVYFLCSDAAPTITGVTLPIDAGWLVQAPYAAYMAGNPIKPRP
jgi:NAD(P)-dependent dehydrogenase (short-subunit alcohol dehydrogenase family)